MLASTWMDLVMGVDLHFEMVPMPAPTPVPFPHPFIGMVFDPAGMATEMATGAMLAASGVAPPPTGPVLINGLAATNTGTDVKNSLVLPHFVIPPGTMWTPFPKAPDPKIGKHKLKPPAPPVAPAGDAVLMMGSMTVDIRGSSAVRLGDVAMSCSEPVRLPSSTVLAIPKGPPVLIGGPPALNMAEAAGALLRSKWAAGKLHQLVSRVKSVRLRNLLHKSVCFLTGHPVDVATGRVLTWVTDFELPGPLPLKFERNYLSSFSSRASVLGHGWNHSLNERLWLEPGKVVYLAEDGREIEFDTFDFPERRMRIGDEVYEPINRLTLKCTGPFSFEVRNAEGVSREFSLLSKDAPLEYRLLRIRHRAGHEIRLQYDPARRLEWVTDSAGRRIRFVHDEKGRLVQVSLPHPTDEHSFVVHRTYAYSDEGDLIEVRDAEGRAYRYEYRGHLLTRETNRSGLSFYFGYDGIGESAYCVRTWGDGGIYDHEISYDKKRRVTLVKNSLGAVTAYFMNPAGAVVKVLDAHGGATEYAYDDDLRRTAVSDALGDKTEFAYDGRGNLTRALQPDGAALEFEYDAFNQPVRAKDALGGEWTWRYSETTGLLLERTNPLGERYEYGYAKGLLSSVTSPNGAKTRLTHDEELNVSTIHLADGGQVQLEHDRQGRLVLERNPAGGERRFRYDFNGLPVEVNEADGNLRRLRYDAEGNVLEMRDALTVVQWTYAGLNKLTSVTEDGATVKLIHDTEEQLVRVVNEAGEEYVFVRDALGDISEERGFDGGVRYYVRDKLGRVVFAVKPSGISSTFEYDNAGRVTKTKHSDGTDETYAYRIDGALLEAKTPHCTVRFERDALGRVVKEWQGEHCIESAWGLDGRRAILTSSLGARQVLHRNELGDVEAMSVGTSSSPLELLFKRDALGLEVERRLPGAVTLSTERDVIGRPLRQTLFQGPLETQRRVYSWDRDWRLQTILDAPGGRVDFVHDGRSRLIRSETRPGDEVLHRAMDEVGNLYRRPDKSDRRYGKGGVLLEAEGTRYENDADGNLRRKVLPDGSAWTYEWSANGNLKQVTRPDGNKVAFEYDAFARRTRKRTKDGDTVFVWDGNVVLHELKRSLKPEDGTGAVALSATTWLWEAESFAPVLKLEGDKHYGIVTDHLGTPRELFDEHGLTAWRKELDTWGRLQPKQTDIVETACPWRWPGQYEDAETGLHYNRHRYYDPEAGRYISQDPIGIEGGLPLYGHVDDPLTWTDLLGLSGCKASELDLIEPGTPAWRRAVESIRLGGKKGINYRVRDQRIARALLEEARPGIPRRRSYPKVSSNHGFEYHLKNESITVPENDLRHIKWYDWRARSPSRGNGHVFFDSWS